MKNKLLIIIIFAILIIGIFIAYKLITNEKTQNNNEEKKIVKSYDCTTNNEIKQTIIDDVTISFEYKNNYKFKVTDNKLDTKIVKFTEECTFKNINDYNTFINQSTPIGNENISVTSDNEKLKIYYDRYTILGQKYQESKEIYLSELKMLGYTCTPNYDN